MGSYIKTICALVAALLFTSAAVLAFEPGTVVAYSLREASAEAAAGSNSAQLKELAGITRFAGFVYDADGGDIILVGKVLPQEPAITLDDLVTGLRARLLYNEWPLVSIDPTNDTETTGQQNVRLEGHIDGTQWGLDFLRADVALKHLCLKTMAGDWPIRSYRNYLEDDIRLRARASGANVTAISWKTGSQAEVVTSQHVGNGIQATTFASCRFWFCPTARQRSVYEPEGVFCIKELRLGVLPEENGATNDNRTNSPGTLFAQAFSDSFETMSAHEPLARLKGLYDLVAIAEAIRTNGLQSVVANLIATYSVTAVKVPSRYPLEELIGDVSRTDGRPQLPVCPPVWIYLDAGV